MPYGQVIRPPVIVAAGEDMTKINHCESSSQIEDYIGINASSIQAVRRSPWEVEKFMNGLLCISLMLLTIFPWMMNSFSLSISSKAPSQFQMVKLCEKCDVYSLSHVCPVVVWYTSCLCGSLYRQITTYIGRLDLHKPLSRYRYGPSVRYLSVMAVMSSYDNILLKSVLFCQIRENTSSSLALQ